MEQDPKDSNKSMVSLISIVSVVLVVILVTIVTAHCYCKRKDETKESELWFMKLNFKFFNQ